MKVGRPATGRLDQHQPAERITDRQRLLLDLVLLDVFGHRRLTDEVAERLAGGRERRS